MKYSTAKEHRDFFQKQGWIEFEGLIPEEQLISVNAAIEQVLGERLIISPSGLKSLSSEQRYVHGHDLWRSHPVLKKFVSNTRFAEIVSELIEKKPLRLGYDQLLPSSQDNPFTDKSEHVYLHFMEQISTLQNVSCLLDVVCGFIVSLNDCKKVREEPVAGADVFPSQAGRVIFFKPELDVNWAQIQEHMGQKFYMVVYTQMTSHYQLQPQDPHTHALKRLGYVFNDKLSDKLNPIIYR